MSKQQLELIEEQTEEKQSEQQQNPVQQLMDVLKQFPTAPTQDEVEKWKTKYGDVFVSGFSDNELFIWRTINRREWLDLQLKMSQKENTSQMELEELICEFCVLWKSIKLSWSEGKAGTPSVLHEQILQRSNFMNPQTAATMMLKL